MILGCPDYIAAALVTGTAYYEMICQVRTYRLKTQSRRVVIRLANDVVLIPIRIHKLGGNRLRTIRARLILKAEEVISRSWLLSHLLVGSGMMAHLVIRVLLDIGVRRSRNQVAGYFSYHV